jgi:fatty acid desaturase
VSLTVLTDAERQAIEEKWTLPRFLFFPAGLIGLYGLAHAWPVDHWAVRVGWTIYTAYVFFCWTSCFHETVHQTLVGSRTFSIALGRLLGTLVLVPYTVYRESHIRHHAYLNKPNDWELWPYSDPGTSLGFRRVFVWVDLFLGAFTAPYVYGRIFFHRDSPLRSRELRRTIWLEYLGMAAFWTTLIGVIAYRGTWTTLAACWLIPHLLAGFYQTARKLTEHLGMASYDPLQGTRTVVGSNWFTRLCTFLNFDIFVHGPHHRHPRVSHDQLRRKMDEYRESHPDQPYPVFRTYLRATWDMLPWMFRNPGVGMNVGAPAPAREKDGDVRNFVADVNEEILADADQADAPPVRAPHFARKSKSERRRVG